MAILETVTTEMLREEMVSFINAKLQQSSFVVRKAMNPDKVEKLVDEFIEHMTELYEDK